MDALAGVHQKVKTSVVPDSTRQMVSRLFIDGSKGALNLFLDSSSSSTEVKIAYDLRRDTKIPYVCRCVLLPRPVRCRDCVVINIPSLFSSAPLTVYKTACLFTYIAHVRKGTSLQESDETFGIRRPWQRHVHTKENMNRGGKYHRCVATNSASFPSHSSSSSSSSPLETMSGGKWCCDAMRR